MVLTTTIIAERVGAGQGTRHPAILLMIYIYGYLNRIQSTRRLEREAQRNNVELMWLTGRLAQDFKTIADFRKDNGKAIRSVCRHFVVLCRNQGNPRDSQFPMYLARFHTAWVDCGLS